MAKNTPVIPMLDPIVHDAAHAYCADGSCPCHANQYSRADVERFFLSCCGDPELRRIYAIERLTDLSQPTWLLHEWIKTDFTRQMSVVHVISVGRGGKLALCHRKEAS